GAGGDLVPGACGRPDRGGVHQLVRGSAAVCTGGRAGRIAADALVGVRTVVPGGPVPAVLGSGGDPGAAAGSTFRAVTELSRGPAFRRGWLLVDSGHGRRLRPPARAHRVLHAGRRRPSGRPVRRGTAPRPEVAGDHRPRVPFRCL